MKARVEFNKARAEHLNSLVRLQAWWLINHQYWIKPKIQSPEDLGKFSYERGEDEVEPNKTQTVEQQKRMIMRIAKQMGTTDHIDKTKRKKKPGR